MSDQNTTLRPESPLNQKGPIWQQIAKSAEADYAEFGDTGSETRANILGRTDQDKIATNRTVEEAIKILNLYAWMLDTNEDRDTLIKELEKLRR